MLLKQQIITLKITVSEDYSAPEDWDWQGILDLNPSIGENCEFLDYSKIEIIEG